MSTKKNIYIRILKYANRKGEFTMDELYDELKLNQKQKDFVNSGRGTTGLICNTGRIKEEGTNKNSTFTISAEGTFKLLEYEELEEARKSSKWAMRFAIIAMLLTILSVIAQMVYPIYLDDKQFNKFIEVISTK